MQAEQSLLQKGSSKRERCTQQLLTLSSVWQSIVFFSCRSQGLADTFWRCPLTIAFPDLIWSHIFSPSRLGWVCFAAGGTPLFCHCFSCMLSPVQSSSSFPMGQNNVMLSIFLFPSSSSSPPPPYLYLKTSPSYFRPTPELHKWFCWELNLTRNRPEPRFPPSPKQKLNLNLYFEVLHGASSPSGTRTNYFFVGRLSPSCPFSLGAFFGGPPSAEQSGQYLRLNPVLPGLAPAPAWGCWLCAYLCQESTERVGSQTDSCPGQEVHLPFEQSWAGCWVMSWQYRVA